MISEAATPVQTPSSAAATTASFGLGLSNATTASTCATRTTTYIVPVRDSPPRKDDTTTITAKRTSRVNNTIASDNVITRIAFIRVSNAQLTDGGPPPTPESPGRIAGPPFGEAPGSAL